METVTSERASSSEVGAAGTVERVAETQATPVAGAARPELEEHLIGSRSSGKPGPLVLVVGGIHGNEPAGVQAIRTVLRRLEQEGLALAGRLVGVAGNLEALRRDVRFVERDLNRMWTARELGAVRARRDVGEGSEERARRRLLALFESEIQRHREGPVVLLDLHSTSAGGPPFSVIGDTLQNRKIAFALPAPVILGLEEAVDGALLEFFGEHGHVAVGFEGGEHSDPRTALNHEAAIWLALIAAGALDAKEHGALRDEMRARLAASTRGLPPVVEIRHRHGIEGGDGFAMRPGYANFAGVRAGEVLAHDAQGEIRATLGGRVLLPLYQGLGQDGFFLGRDVRPFWLALSASLRKLHTERALALLPGVSRYPGRSDSFLVDPRIARLWPVQLFHLLGYRRRRPEGDRLRFSRRVERPRN